MFIPVWWALPMRCVQSSKPGVSFRGPRSPTPETDVAPFLPDGNQRFTSQSLPCVSALLFVQPLPVSYWYGFKYFSPIKHVLLVPSVTSPTLTSLITVEIPSKFFLVTLGNPQSGYFVKQLMSP